MHSLNFFSVKNLFFGLRQNDLFGSVLCRRCSVISLDDVSCRQDRLSRQPGFLKKQCSQTTEVAPDWAVSEAFVGGLPGNIYQLLTSEDGRSDGPAKTLKEERTKKKSRNNVMVTTKVRRCYRMCGW